VTNKICGFILLIEKKTKIRYEKTKWNWSYQKFESKIYQVCFLNKYESLQDYTRQKNIFWQKKMYGLLNRRTWYYYDWGYIRRYKIEK